MNDPTFRPPPDMGKPMAPVDESLTVRLLRELQEARVSEAIALERCKLVRIAIQAMVDADYEWCDDAMKTLAEMLE